MKIAPTQGAPRVWTPVAPGEAESMWAFSANGDTYASVPIKVITKNEVTKSGLSRVMIKFAVDISAEVYGMVNPRPRSTTNIYGCTQPGNTPITAHLVLSAPRGTFQTMNGDVAALVRYMLASLTTVVRGNSEDVAGTAGEVPAYQNLLDALRGAYALDVQSGEYGQQSASGS